MLGISEANLKGKVFTFLEFVLPGYFISKIFQK